jgi:putative transposase
MESFFDTVKTERVHHKVYATRDQARRDRFGSIGALYNYRRLHSALGYFSRAAMERRAA